MERMTRKQKVSRRTRTPTIQRIEPESCSNWWEPLQRDFTVARPKSPIFTVRSSWRKISGTTGQGNTLVYFWAPSYSKYGFSILILHEMTKNQNTDMTITRQYLKTTTHMLDATIQWISMVSSSVTDILYRVSYSIVVLRSIGESLHSDPITLVDEW